MNTGAETITLRRLRDLSEWQGNVAWDRYATTEHPQLVAVYIRAGRGPGIPDKQIGRNLRLSRRSKMHVGCYWYLVPGMGSPESQVDALLRLAPRRGGANLRPLLDIEDGSPAGRRDWYARSIAHARRRLGYWPAVYGSPGYLGPLELPRWAAHCPLMIADYGVAVPRLPAPWHHWAAWQYSSSATDPVTDQHPVDDSYLADLRALLVPTRRQRLRGVC